VTPDIAPRLTSLSSGAIFDVYSMVVGSFQHGAIALTYGTAMIVLFLHLFHGIQAFFQTMGWNNDGTITAFVYGGKVAAFILLLGYSSIPAFIFFQFLT
jgi:succinate dehydrogenase / fumarate reductase cytochrome b subunit